MRRALVAVTLAIVTATGCAAAVPAPRVSPPPSGSTIPADADGTATVNRITYSHLLSDDAWQLDLTKHPVGIQGYADATDVIPGAPVGLYVSSTAPTYTVQALRIGWYDDTHHAALIWTSPTLPGHRQAPAVTAPTTYLVSAPWHRSVTVPTGGWPPGDYLFLLTDAAGHRAYVPLTLDSPSTRGRLVLMNDVATWQEYNPWGGRNGYYGPRHALATRSTWVSYDRPYYDEIGAGSFFIDDYAALVLAERLDIPLAYGTDVTLDRDRGWLADARALVSMGHDEYYSAAMLDALLRARRAGTNLIFLGGNDLYRHLRFDALTGDRVQVNYKLPDADPIRFTDPEANTVSWRDSAPKRPESLLLGQAYQCERAHGELTVADANSWLLTGLNVHDGDQLGQLVGTEIDGVNAAQPVPHPLDVLFATQTLCQDGRAHLASTSYYTAPSGAGVFDAGYIAWECELAADQGPGRCTFAPGYGSADGDRVVTAVTQRLLRAAALGPLGLAHPAYDDTTRLGVPIGSWPGY